MSLDRVDHELAAHLADGAGKVLLDLRARMLAEGADRRSLKDQGDRVSHEWLLEQLDQARPNDAVLSEEATAHQERSSGRLDARRVWIIDPVDGTREYGEGRADWAVHVALTIDGEAALGAVALPQLGEVYSSGAPVPVPPAPERLRVVVSRTRPAPEALAVAEALDAEILAMGSAGAKTMAILRGEADIYPHSGGQYEWDSCAPVAVATSAGLHCSRIDGSPLRYNRPDPWLPDLLVCRHEHAPRILTVTREFGIRL